jgi:hypothetical protein
MKSKALSVLKSNLKQGNYGRNEVLVSKLKVFIALTIQKLLGLLKLILKQLITLLYDQVLMIQQLISLK